MTGSTLGGPVGIAIGATLVGVTTLAGLGIGYLIKKDPKEKQEEEKKGEPEEEKKGESDEEEENGH